MSSSSERAAPDYEPLARGMGARMARRMGTRMGTWLGMAFRLGMEWTTLRRGARILWRRMRRPAVGPRPVGTTQDSRQQVLVKRLGAILGLTF